MLFSFLKFDPIYAKCHRFDDSCVSLAVLTLKDALRGMIMFLGLS